MWISLDCSRELYKEIAQSAIGDDEIILFFNLGKLNVKIFLPFELTSGSVNCVIIKVYTVNQIN